MKRKYIYTLTTLALVIGILGLSFGYLKDIKQSSENTTINLANFGVKFADGKNVGVVTFPTKTYPMSDAEGLNNPSITFGIENAGEVDAHYKVSLIDGQVPSTMLNKDARYQLKKGVNGATPTVVGIFNLRDDGIIDEGTINSGDTIDYELIMWIDYDANPNGLSFNKYVSVEGMQIPNIDTSGANFPELADNMIPVYYDETNAVWKKADPTNGLDPETNEPVTTENYPYQWFNYDSQMWANAVTVKESGTQTRDYYLNADLGTTIDMNDITTMWVWIPRFKYVIFNGNNGTAEEQMINVTFEHGRETTGTVRCHDDINTSDHSEICTDTTNGSIVNHKSTYTHPAFCFGTKNEDGSCNGEELTGFWMAKFEMSTDDATCNGTSNETNCDKQGLNILVKPDQYTLNYENITTMFANIRRMETYGNIHGFEQNASATTWLDSSGNLTGEINNDNNTLDTHMIKNMEWGAVAYLSQSKYGKQGNNDYEGAYKEVYVNNNYDIKTGYSGGSYDSAAGNVLNSNTYLYNNLTSNETGQGYKGAGASTTGTVYGVYDMNGGLWEIVLYNMTDNFGNFNPKNSYWTSNGNIPLSKYYDSYYYLYGIHNNKLGDTMKEIVKDKTSKFGRWYDDALYLPSVISPFYEYGYTFAFGKSLNSGIFAGDAAEGSNNGFESSRPVLTVSRNMPWLNNN